MHEEYLHTILLSGYDNDKIVYFDPLSGEKLYISKNDLKKIIETPIGKWMLCVKQNSKYKNELFKYIQNYKDMANNLLKYDSSYYQMDLERLYKKGNRGGI